MKRTITTTILVAITLLMAVGAASATCYIDLVQDDQSQYQGYLNATMEVNNASMPYTIVIELTEDTTNNYPNATITTILVNIPAADIDYVVDNNGTIWAVTAAAGNPFGTFITKTSTTETSLKDTDPITIYLKNTWDGTMPANDDGNVISIHIQRIGIDDEGSAWATVGHCDEGGNGGINEIPEFPTVALPIAAIIGLAFVFQRRKE